MRGIIESSLRLRYIVFVIAVAILVFGVSQLGKMPVDVFPEFAPPYVEIQTEALGLSAAEVESLITIPMEEVLHGVSWVKTMRSESIPGLSSIVLFFEPGTDLLRARALVQERITQAHGLPTKSVSKPPTMLQPLSSTSRVMMIGLSSSKVSLIDMSVLARWTIRPRLMGVPGVANVAIWGQRERQLQVQVDPERLRANGVSLFQIIKTAGDALWVSPLSYLTASTPGVTGGFVDTPNQRLGIQHLLPIVSAEDLAKVSVDGTSLRLSDVTNVVEDHQPLIGDAVINQGTGLMLVIEKFPGANTLEVTRGVEAALNELRPGLGGIEIDPSIFRPSSYIQLAVNNLSQSLLLAILLIVVGVAIFLFDWRAVLVSLVAIGLSLAAAVIVLYWRGATMNTMVLAGFVVALGIIVDDAVINIENITRRLRENRAKTDAKPTTALMIEAVLEVRGAMVFATMIVLLTALPIIFMQGVPGALFQPLAISFALAALVSMIVALTITPAMILLLSSEKSLMRRESAFAQWLKSGFADVTAGNLRNPYLALFLIALIATIGIGVAPFIGQSLLPTLRENNLVIQWEGAPGTSQPAMSRLAQEASRALQSIPGVRHFGAHIGRAITGDKIVGINSGELWVSIDPSAHYDATVEWVQQVVDNYPGVLRNVQTYMQRSVRNALTGANDPIVVRILGPDQTVLLSKAEQVRQALANIDGISDVRMDAQAQEPTVEIEVDLAKAQPYGIKPGDVRRAAALFVNGIEVGNLFEEQKVFEVIVVGTPDTRHSLTSLRELLIETPAGGYVRLEDVANVRIVSAPNLIRREGISRLVDVRANVRGRDVGEVTREVQARLQQIPFPLEYHPRVLSEYAEQQATQNRMLTLVAAAAIGVFLLLQATFGSWRLAILGFLTLPLTLVGGMVAVFVSGGTVTLGSLVGFLAVFGIAARKLVMLITHYQHLEQVENEPFGPELVLRGTRERFVPILMTAACTGLAVIPLMAFGNIAGHEIVSPMAAVIAGGLITSAVVNLFVVPTLYLWFGRSHEESDETLQVVRPAISGATE